MTSPLHINLLLHYHTTPGIYEPESPAADEYTEELARAGLIYATGEASPEYRTTYHGQRVVEDLCTRLGNYLNPTTPMKLPSQFQIGDSVIFHTRKSKKGTGVSAKVTAVKFTKSKIRYSLDIAGAGPEVHEIDSYFVSAPACTK